VAAGGAVVLLRGSSWPEMGRRYERGGEQGAAATDRARTAPRPVESAWDQLDRGVDPTTDPAPAPHDTSPDPTLGGGDDA
jgi:Tryptophan-associated transmembrane protein (Trp_oprn_chp)